MMDRPCVECSANKGLDAANHNWNRPCPKHFDPRPELSVDSSLWCRLLALAFDYDGREPEGCYGRLHLARCYGAELFHRRDTLLLRGPVGHPEWPALRMELLVSRSNDLARLLKEAA